MIIRFIRSNEKKQIMEMLNKEFGIQELPFLLIESGKEKIRAFSGNLSKEEIQQIGEIANIELIGTYLIRREKENDIRLSFDAPMILKDQISKNIVEINDEQFQKWIHGLDLEMPCPNGSTIIKYKGDLIGCGKSNGTKIFNYVPKDRRLRK